MLLKKNYQNGIINHYEKVLCNKPEIYLWNKGPFEKLPSDFRVLEFSPNKKRKMWTYATCCMSQFEDEEPIELHMFSSVKDEGLIELLASITYYHRGMSQVGLNHTMNFGRQWQSESSCRYGFISLPYLDGPVLENCKLYGRTIKLYWLIPITKEEAEFKAKYGVEALERKFEESGFNYVNPGRVSII